MGKKAALEAAKQLEDKENFNVDDTQLDKIAEALADTAFEAAKEKSKEMDAAAESYADVKTKIHETVENINPGLSEENKEKVARKAAETAQKKIVDLTMAMNCFKGQRMVVTILTVMGTRPMWIDLYVTANI